MPFLGVWKRLRSLLSRPRQELEAVQFSLGDRPVSTKGGGAASGSGKAGRAREGAGAQPGAAAPGEPQLIAGAWPGQKQRSGGRGGQGQPPKGEPIPEDIEEVLRRLAATLHFPESKDVIFRKFVIATRPPTRALLIYIEGIADTKRVEREILFPLMSLPLEERIPKGHLAEAILNRFLPAGSSERKQSLDEIVAGVVAGEAAILLENGDAILADIKAPPSRQPQQPFTERTVRGPQIGFTENHRANTGMLRTFIHDPDLVTEQFTLGRRSKTMVSLMYIADIANPKLVAEARRRLNSLDVDAVTDSGTLQCLIGDHPLNLFPTVLSTERPDRAACQVLAGAVAIVVGGSTRVLVAPATYATFLHTAEDVFLKATSATFLRLIRLAALVLALLLPAIYIAVVNFHQEMIPTPLLLTLAASRESIPFPLIVDLLIMELAFELIREAGLRVPSAIGTTIGIVGALLLGDMAVRSGLVSPSVVIVVAITALASFAIPDPDAAFAIRLGRFIFLALSGVLGFYGVALGLYVMTSQLAALRSFGVPFLSPIGPWRAGPPDVIIRGPVFKQEKRPIHLRPMDLIRQARYARGWDPGLPDPKGQAGGGKGQGRGGKGQGGSENG